MKQRRTCLLLTVLLCVPTASGWAQEAEDDLRGIVPYMMIIVDTSGSMERVPACACSTPSCVECVPDCSLANDVNGNPPADKKNRWAVALEALTGTINNFECEPVARTAANGMTYDLNYYLPYHQPWGCAGSGPCERFHPTATCSSDTDCSTVTGYPYCGSLEGQGYCTAFSQQNNGVLDTYASQVQLGLMTFDGWDTYVGAPAQVYESDFNHPLSESVSGLWSYGGAKTYHYPGCTANYMMDTGGRSPVATEGQLISLDSCTASNCRPWCPNYATGCDPEGSIPAPSLADINAQIQSALISARPYGGTPIAAALDDAYYHFRNDLSDEYGSCRDRYAMLITDGYPDIDYRDVNCDCAERGDPTDYDRCGGNGCGEEPPPPYGAGPPCTNHPDLMHCPYKRAEQVAEDLIHGRDGDPPQIEQLYVIGLAIDDAAAIPRLDAIAANGGSSQAYFADDVPQLIAQLADVMPTPEPISRTVPVFARGRGGEQYQISTGLRVGVNTGDPWSGLIERVAFTCNGPTLEESAPVDLADAPDGLNGTTGDPSTRRLYSAIASASDRTVQEGAMWFGATAPCGAVGGTGCPLQRLREDIDFTLFDLPDQDAKDEMIAWMYGDIGTPREGNRLSDIYHSTPAIAGAPQFDTPDEAFNAFRESDVVTNRPVVMYTGSNDGILHAFSVEDYTTPSTPVLTNQRSLVAGEELWGFVPPMLLDRLRNNALGTHQIMVDGAPVVKNVYFQKGQDAQADASLYHTVLIAGMRAGGNGYVALDVTNPFDPKFLWQFTHPQMGKTYAQPAIVQVAREVTVGTETQTVQRAVAILPGGKGAIGDSGLAGDCDNGVSNPTLRLGSGTGNPYFTYHTVLPVPPATEPAMLPHRTDVPCWQNLGGGRALYFVDVETGQLITWMGSGTGAQPPFFPSPLVSTPAVYQSDIGTLASRAFIVDADGVIWRIDMSSPRPSAWFARPFHDIFHDLTIPDGQPSYEAPILSTDEEGRLVVIAGTGDTDDFTRQDVNNRIVSLREVNDMSVTASPSSPDYFKAALNWEKNEVGPTGMVTSELVTGSMVLFNGQLFIPSFIATAPGGDVCDLGRGRIHAVDYIRPDPLNCANVAGLQVCTPELVVAAADADPVAQGLINVSVGNAVPNRMLLGLSLTQRPTCSVIDPDDSFNVYAGTDFSGIAAVQEPELFLVAHGSGDETQLIRRDELGTVEAQLRKAVSMSRITSWATSVD